MTKTYQIQCLWHIHDEIGVNGIDMGKWQGIMFCEESGYCYGLISDEIFGGENLAFTHYFAGHYEPQKGISFLRASVGQDSLPDDYTLVKDNRNGYCGEISKILLDGSEVIGVKFCGARLKISEVELTPQQFNNLHKEVEKSQRFVGNYLSSVLLTGIEEGSSFMMDSVMELARENVEYQNSKFSLN